MEETDELDFQEGMPFRMAVRKGEKVSICVCGQTRTPPVCDCSHPMHADPYEYEAREDDVLKICRCGRSSAMPWCDESHSGC